jgi:hypothetical protein
MRWCFQMPTGSLIGLYRFGLVIQDWVKYIPIISKIYLVAQAILSRCYVLHHVVVGRHDTYSVKDLSRQV